MAVTLENLVKRYTGPDGSVVPVVDISFFRLDDGEQAALTGSSGSGKTTLLHLIAGILSPDSGHIVFEFAPMPEPATKRSFLRRNWPYIVTAGTPLLFYWLLRKEQRWSSVRSPSGKPEDHKQATPETRSRLSRESSGQSEHVLHYRGGLVPDDDHAAYLERLSEAQRDLFRGHNIGYIFQTHHLLGGFTALENVLLGMSFTGRSADRAWARHLLDEVGLSDRLHYKPEKLSVGQQQRVAVARALANRPKLVLADEPTGALDATNAQQVLDLIRSLCREVNASLLLVSHDLNIANQLPRVVSLAELNRAEQKKKPQISQISQI